MNEESFENFIKNLLDYLNSQEEALKQFKTEIARIIGVFEEEKFKEKWSWSPEKIKWVETEGFRGKYERYPGIEEKAESTSDYKALLEDLKRHNGKLTREGWFYWLFEDASTVGRKKRGEVKP